MLLFGKAVNNDNKNQPDESGNNFLDQKNEKLKKSNIFLDIKQNENQTQNEEDEVGNAKMYSMKYDRNSNCEILASALEFKFKHTKANCIFHSGFISLLCQILSQSECERYILYCHKNKRIYIQDSFCFEKYVLREHNPYFKARLFVLFNRQMHVRGFFEVLVSCPNSYPNLVTYKHKSDNFMSLIGASLMPKHNCCSLHPLVKEFEETG